ncbi:NUDIX hydrolase [Putridiphycobacter roseus]|uniref:NUDIX hydrolase n=1 Tax=Putridiphycobacter roseus TaxID=2219161 RepID=A0A2W1NSB4_9FLAO|nr:NUDIX domain-containing protein [Putridiphycobacter roseus]PZE17558.1 NUDIX hydrolase [Putridiphycobacter roseus]
MKTTQNIDVTVDAIVFGYNKEIGVTVLLIKRKNDPFKGQWALPGGFVEPTESLELAVARELKEETGVKINYLEQLYTFGQPDRDPRKRIISVAYFGIVKSSQFKKLKAADDAEDAEWFKIKHLPALAFDHQKILKMAIDRLRSKMIYQPIGFELLDKKFPFSDLEHLYSTLLGRPIDRRNFRKKVMGLGILEELDEKAPSLGAGRPGNLFQFNKATYNQLVKEGMHFEI